MTPQKTRKMTSQITAGKSEGLPVYTAGKPVAFLGIPADMVGSRIYLQGSFDGTAFFAIRDLKGSTYSVPTAPAVQDNSTFFRSLNLPFVMPLPVEITNGIQIMRAISDKAEKADAGIDFYLLD